MLIYLNAAFVSWRTVSGRFSDAANWWRSRDTRSRTIARCTTVTQTIYLLILIAAFIGIVVWVFGRKRKARFEANARIPLDEDRRNQP